MPSRSEATETSLPPPTQPEAPLQAVLEAFRAAATGSIAGSARGGADDPRVLFAESYPRSALMALEVELYVGVEWQEDRCIRLLFDPSPHAASRIKFRSSRCRWRLCTDLTSTSRNSTTLRVSPGLHQYEVRITDEKNAPAGNAPLILRIVRADKARGQEKRVRFQATPDGIATFVVDAMGRMVQAGENPEEETSREGRRVVEVRDRERRAFDHVRSDRYLTPRKEERPCPLKSTPSSSAWTTSSRA